MAEWVPPKTNWQAGDVPGAGDFNRIESNIAVAKSHMDATSGIHGATSLAAPNRLVIRDSAGRAQFTMPSASEDAATKRYVDDLVRSLLAGTAFAYYLTPPSGVLGFSNTDYDNWWVQDINKSVVVRILLPGTIRFHLEHRASAAGGTCHVRILRNGTEIYVALNNSSDWRTVTDVITVNPGDIITIQKRTSNSSYPAYWRNVRIETDQPPLGIQRF